MRMKSAFSLALYLHPVGTERICPIRPYPKTGFVNGMVAYHLLCHSGTINRNSLNGALLS